MKMTLIKITSSWLCATGVAVISSYCILTHNNGKAGDQKKAEQIAYRASKRGTVSEYKSTNKHSSAVRKTTKAKVVKEIKKVCGEDYPVSLRYSVCSMTRGFNQGAVPGEEFTEVGRSMEESEKAIRILEEAGYDMFDCDNGTYDAWYWAHPPVYAPLNTNLKYVEHIKRFTTKPVVSAGRMQPDAAAKAIAAGRIDAMGVGRQSSEPAITY